MLARYVGQHGEEKRTAVAARYFVGLTRAMPAGARRHGRTERQGMPQRRGVCWGFLKQLTMIAFLLDFCGIDLFEAGPWAVGAHRGMRRRVGACRGDGLLVAALGRVRGACEHGGVSAQSKAGRVGPVRQRRKGKGGRGAALSVEERR